MPRLASRTTKPPSRRRTTLQGYPLHIIWLLSINMIFFALVLPTLEDTPLRFLFKYASLKHYRSHTNTSAHDGESAMELFRAYKVMPPLVGLRTTEGDFDFARRKLDGPILYYGFHVLPAVIWSISMPIQHVKRFRSFTGARIHRWSGYITLTCSFILSISGLVIPRKGLNFRHPDYFHLHVLRIRSVPVFAWPNFALQTDLLVPMVLLTAYKTLVYARRKKIASHKFWAQLHTYISYAVPLERVWMYVIMLIGMGLPLLPPSVLAWLEYPLTDADISSAEVSGLASTVFLTFLTVAIIAYTDYRSGRIKQA